ncbi:MAG: hypothetical protein AAGD38_19080, partial [Acidobacteriota bacterium]
MHLRFLVLFTLISGFASAMPPIEEPRLLVDIQNATEAGSVPTAFTRIDDVLYFMAADRDGLGLFRTQGQVGDVVRITTTGEHAETAELVVHPAIDGVFLVLGDRYAETGELWHVDLVTGDARRLWQRTGILFWVALDDRLVFFERNRIWQSDGVETSLVGTTTGPVYEPSSVHAVVGDRIFFSTLDPAIVDPLIRGDLWSTDGTPAGTVKLSSIVEPRTMAADDQQVYFHATSSAELWTTSGTPATTQSWRAIDPCLDYVPLQLHTGDGALFFAERQSGSCWLRRIDPSSEIVTTVSTTPIRSATTSNATWLTYFDEAGAPYVLRFGASPVAAATLCPSSCAIDVVELRDDRLMLRENADDVFRLWSSGGAPSDAWLLVDRAEWLVLSSDPVMVGEDLYFQARSPSSTWHLWRARPGQLAEIVSPAFDRFESPIRRQLTVMDDRVVFLANESTFGAEPWVSDGSASGTMLLDDLLTGDVGITPEILHTTATMTFFRIQRGDQEEIWSTDGTAEGTVQLFDLRFLSAPAVVDDQLFIVEELEDRLWVTDGTVAGTKVLIERPGLLRSHLTTADRYFFSESGVWWSTDGTLEGTVSLGVPRSDGDCAKNGDFCLLFAPDGAVWSSDGTPQGTELITTIDNYSGAEPLETEVVFEADRMLWFSDGTSTGTRRVVLLDQGGIDQFWFPTANGVFGLRRDDPARWRLWSYDGVFVSLVRVLNEPPIIWGFFGDRLVYSDQRTGAVWVTGNGGQIDLPQLEGETIEVIELSSDEAFLVASTSLWRTDGTVAGTVRVTDRQVDNPTVIDGLLVFHSNGETWRSDGTPSGTFAIWPEGRQLQQQPVVTAKHLVMPWYRPETGEDLYALPKTVLAAEDERLRLSADERFRITVTWRTLSGEVGRGKVVPITGDTGSFWFFSDDNLELMIKVLDGRALN